MIVNNTTYITKGTTSVIKCIVKEAYDKNGNLITSLAGYTVRLRVKNEISDSNVLFEKIGNVVSNNVIHFFFSGNEFNSVRDYETVYANVVIEGNDGTKVTVDGENGNIFPIIVLPYI